MGRRWRQWQCRFLFFTEFSLSGGLCRSHRSPRKSSRGIISISIPQTRPKTQAMRCWDRSHRAQISCPHAPQNLCLSPLCHSPPFLILKSENLVCVQVPIEAHGMFQNSSWDSLMWLLNATAEAAAGPATRQGPARRQKEALGVGTCWGPAGRSPLESGFSVLIPSSWYVHLIPQENCLYKISFWYKCQRNGSWIFFFFKFECLWSAVYVFCLGNTHWTEIRCFENSSYQTMLIKYNWIISFLLYFRSPAYSVFPILQWFLGSESSSSMWQVK